MNLTDLIKHLRELKAKGTDWHWEALDSKVQFAGLTHRKDVWSGAIGCVSRYQVASGVCQNEAELITETHNALPQLLNTLEELSEPDYYSDKAERLETKLKQAAEERQEVERLLAEAKEVLEGYASCSNCRAETRACTSNHTEARALLDKWEGSKK
jgi:uncharacterized coiled-coil DUF342 family protein